MAFSLMSVNNGLPIAKQSCQNLELIQIAFLELICYDT